MSRAFHIAFEDDWEQSIGFGSYEAATRGHPYEPGDYIRATTADGVQGVLDERYADLVLPVLVVELSVDAITEAGIPVTRDAASGHVGIDGPLPPGDPTIVLRVLPAHRSDERWLAPELGAR